MRGETVQTTTDWEDADVCGKGSHIIIRHPPHRDGHVPHTQGARLAAARRAAARRAAARLLDSQGLDRLTVYHLPWLQ